MALFLKTKNVIGMCLNIDLTYIYIKQVIDENITSTQYINRDSKFYTCVFNLQEIILYLPLIISVSMFHNTQL